MKTILILFALILAGCGTSAGTKLTAASVVVRAVVVKTIDAKMDSSRRFVCNNTYRAEMAARQRWGVKAPSWNDFCGRLDGPGR